MSTMSASAAKQWWTDMMGAAHPSTIPEPSRRDRAATKAVGAGPKGRGGEAPELISMQGVPA